MGAHKQRWTAEEEAALKAGVVKHGMGKWRTILTDPEFSSLLRLRSNVDLKDKWRNINVTANGWGSRHRARVAIKKSQTTPKRDDNLVFSTVPGSVEEVVDAKPLAVSRGTPRAAGSKEPNKRLDSLVLEALTSLKEPGGSDKHAIAMYIEEQYWAPHNLKKLLSTKLKHMSANGKLIKVRVRIQESDFLYPQMAGYEDKKFTQICEESVESTKFWEVSGICVGHGYGVGIRFVGTSAV